MLALCLAAASAVSAFTVRERALSTRTHITHPEVPFPVSASSTKPKSIPSSLLRTPLTRSGFEPVFSSRSGSDAEYDEVCDVLVLGSGPAARAMASLLSSKRGGGSSLDVILADTNVDRAWPPNYGVWQDEWEAVVQKYKQAGVDVVGGKDGNSIDHTWKITDCFFGGSFGTPMTDRMRLDREYCRVDKQALASSLLPQDEKPYRILRAKHISRAIGVNLYEPAGTFVHDSTGTTVQLRTRDGDPVTVRSRLVVDATGHETTLTLRETRGDGGAMTQPGFQIAYGCLVAIDKSSKGFDSGMIGPYDKEAMTLFDYRTDHYDGTPADMVDQVENSPTFMYVMPLSGNKVFFEETSLVARPGVSFQECKDRCFKRLEYLGIQVTDIEEEEFCYIPMGGSLPAKDQRVIGIGGASAMVHPSTGYHICRCLMGTADAASVIRNQLSSTQNDVNLSQLAGDVYHAIWSPENIQQRNFAVFGGEFLMKQNVAGLRGFFDAFFRLPMGMWSGFLAGWPGLPHHEFHNSWYARMWYGLNFVVRLPPSVAFDMFTNIVSYSLNEGVSLPQSVTPLLGEPRSYRYKPNLDGIGDVAAKNEARRMIQESAVEDVVPVAFMTPSVMSPATLKTSLSEGEKVDLSSSFQ
jgi:lycopene beta-cyclase